MALQYWKRVRVAVVLTLSSASNAGANDEFGIAVALTGDGSTLAVGARGEASTAVGIGGKRVDNSLDRSGAIYLY